MAAIEAEADAGVFGGVFVTWGHAERLPYTWPSLQEAGGRSMLRPYEARRKREGAACSANTRLDERAEGRSMLRPYEARCKPLRR